MKKQAHIFEPTERDIVKMAMAAPLEEKIKIAIGLLQLHESSALGLSPHGYHLAYSGGKDSDVILQLAKMAGVKYRPVYNVTTIDPPELVRYIKRQHPYVEFNRPEMAMLTMMVEHQSCKGPPTRLSRWCCEKYKEHGGDGMFKIIGVRAAESPRRAATWKQVVNHRSKNNDSVYICPIVYWTNDDVWEFHRLTEIKHCELYDEGFNRLGCIGCPLSGPIQQRIGFGRWPNYEKAWRRAFDRFWDKWHGVSTLKGKRRWFEDFGSAQGLWDWWVTGKRKAEGDGQCQFDFLYM